MAHRPGLSKHKSFLLRKAGKVQGGITAGLEEVVKKSMIVPIDSGSELGHINEQKFINGFCHCFGPVLGHILSILISVHIN